MVSPCARRGGEAERLASLCRADAIRAGIGEAAGGFGRLYEGALDAADQRAAN
jgi:hypothetical protein